TPAAPVVVDPVAQQVEIAFQSSVEANKFRMTPRDGEPVETVSRAYLTTLQRESAALRAQGDELVRLRRTVELLSAGGASAQSPSSPSVEVERPAGDGIYVPVYDFDGLRNDPYIVHNHDFMRDPRFVAAYKRAVQATVIDHRYYWRVHVALWCASLALRLDGDFVECGVWKGLLSTAIASYYDWNKVGRKFFLFDTFRGVDETQLADEELINIPHFRIGYGEDIYDHVVRNFAEFKDVVITRGSVPETLTSVDIGKVAYLSIDMNNAAPEIAAATYFWDKLLPGAPILLDDYGFVRYEAQKEAFDKFAAERGVAILALPTGQGLMIKPYS
ncbi:MAG: TylF/MycF/NovP-related O-methyltransferase, partial [Bradyrhizobium sp.]|nr:TylF/MycF/NovP-related O-methyltransferase [Bradyrhizobium sp.]